MKLIYIVLDGVADRLIDEKTSLELANKPNLDVLARRAKAGMMYTVARGIAPESDAAVFSILGYDPRSVYTGRGPLEALGADLSFKEKYEVAFRANFATVDPKTLRIIDRRVKRQLTTEEAKELAKAIDGINLGIKDCYVKVAATVGHRAVVVIGCKEALSDNVENTDPAYVKKGKISIAVKSYEPYIKPCKALDHSFEASLTAKLVNIFTRKAIEILDKHPINKLRENKGLLKANAILLRDGGNELPKIKPIAEVFNVAFGAVAEMPVEIGIAKLLGMKIANVPPPSEDKRKDYELRLRSTLKLLNEVDIVYVHLKGPDEPAHDGSLLKKVEAIEMIDKYFIGPLLDSIDLNKIALLITADHATPPLVKSHTDDPVPILLVAPSLGSDGLIAFTEKECLTKGSLGVIEHGYQLLPKVLRMLSIVK